MTHALIFCFTLVYCGCLGAVLGVFETAFPSKWGCGRILTMPLRRHIRPLYPRARCRGFQVMILGFVAMSGTYSVTSRWWPPLCSYGAWIAALIIDDLASDVDWKKKLRKAANRIRWRMRLPAPARAEPGTA